MKQKSKIETFNLKFFLIKLHFKTKQLIVIVLTWRHSGVTRSHIHDIWIEMGKKLVCKYHKL